MAVTQNALFQQIFVSLFDQVQGSVQNVNVSGRIDIINLNPSVTTNIILSRMFGNVLVPLNLRSGNQSLFQSVSSNIQYYINGNLITQDNQTISGLIGASIRYVNSFEEAKTEVELGDNPSLYEMNVTTLSGTLQTMVSSKYLYLTQITVTNRSDISQLIPIYTKFDPQVQKNAFTDYYLNAYLRIEEQKHQISNLTKYMFGVQYTVINDIPLQNIRFVVFTSETKAVLLKDNSFIKICENSLILDTVSLTCILRSSCQGYILNATCLRQCPLDHWFVVIGIEKLCYLKCPIHLNYYNTTNLNGVLDPRTSQCLYCSGIARENDCQLECQTQNLFLFSQGCFASCPTGTITMGSNICQSPSSLNQCSNNYISLFDYSSNQYYDICSDQVPSYMYVKISSIRTVLWMCAGKATINNICDTTNVSQCTVRSGLSAIPVENQSDNSLLCQLSCISGLLNNSNACVNSCPDLYYAQLFTGSCLQCFTNDYDGGQFWSRATRACVSSCNYINLTSSVKACEIPTDLTNCPIKSELAQITQFQCITTECPINLFIQNDYCRKSCYIPKGLFVQNDNKTCLSTCALGQYIIVLYPMNVFCIDICPENHVPISQSVYSIIPYEQCMPVYECVYYLILQAKVCSTLNCVETSGYYEIDGAGNKICNPCNGSQGGSLMKYKIGFICISTPCSFYLNMNSLSCSTTSCAETSGFYQVDGSGNKICNPCNGTVKYKTGLVCSQTPCTFYINITLFTCSNASCAETSGFYEIDGAGNKICNPCDGSQGGPIMKYKTGLQCSSTPCAFFITEFQCSTSSCVETTGFYYVDGSNIKICNLCDGTQGGQLMKYKTGYVCTSTPCTFFTDFSSFSCSISSCTETLGYYEIDQFGNMICNLCDGTQGLQSMKYKTGLVCSSIPCTFYINITKFTCSINSCIETSGFYEIDGAGNKICNPCDGSQGGSSMKYKNGQVCISTPCIFYINYNNNQCSIDSCEETSGNYYTNINKNKICFQGCPLGYKVYNGNCYLFCPVNAQFLQINGTECDTSCNGLNIYQIGDQKNCVSACDPQYYLRQGELGYQICINCSSDKIALRINGQCILKSNCVYFNVDLPVCESGLSDNCQKIIAIGEYIFQCRQNCTGYFEYQNQCYQKCPNNTLIDVTATLCIISCQFYRLITIFGISQAQCQSDVCLDYKYIDQQYHSIVEGCFLICPTDMLQTRSKSCVKDCKIFDVYPNPNYCETPGTPLCYNYRLISYGSNQYICTTCTLLEFINGFECSPNCDGQFVYIVNKFVCSSTCGSYPKGYTEEIINSIVVNVCQSSCPAEKPNYDTLTIHGTQRCFASYCGPNGKFLETNMKCVSMCASGNYFINKSSSNKFQCLNFNQSCDKFYINEGMKECYSSCPLIYPFLNGSECLKSCNSYMNDLKSPTQKICLSSCGGINPPYILIDENGNTQCTSDCGDLFVQYNGKQFKCVIFCQFYTWDGRSKICTTSCEYYSIDSTKNSIAQWCADSCATFNLIYILIDASARKQCVSSCPNSQPFLEGTVCNIYCSYIVKQQITDVSQYKCQSNPCPKYYYTYPTDNTISICTQNCFGSTPYVFGTLCVSNCLLTVNKFVGQDGFTCVSTCSEEYAMNTTVAIWFCDQKCDFYQDSGLKTCTLTGINGYIYKQIYKQIITNESTITRYYFVTSCPNNEYSIVGGIYMCQPCILYELVGVSHKCVQNCSDSQVQFKFQCFTGLCKYIMGIGQYIYSGLDKKCGLSCGDGFVLDQASFQCTETCSHDQVYYLSGVQKICTKSCTGDNDYVTLDQRYVKNGVGQCVPTCPVGSFKELLQFGQTYKFCVDQCVGKQYQIVDGENICVINCPIYVVESNGVKRCYESCTDTNQMHLKVVLSVTDTQCVSICPQNYPFMPANGELQCIQTCANLFYSLFDNQRRCLDSCPFNISSEITFIVPNHLLCTAQCGSQQMFLRVSGIIGSCLTLCPPSQNYYDQNRECLRFIG
ncbi:Conserved_hypothetical protein [Hexamita inflata]|uniref:Uncharacterized protein n=1 Tax=Hexamita inflata TaxID=28002 RepID=A0ABP1IQX7_9EUKA